jgi:hypothetical protein
MIKKAILITICSLLLSGCTLGIRKSALEIYSSPNAKVFIDGKEMGMTPYKNSNLKPINMEIKLTVGGKQVVKKIGLKNGLTTVVDWKFDDNGDDGGYVLSMENTGGPKCGLLINSIPSQATIAVENEIIGFTPKRIDDLGEGEKHVAISFPGYQSTNLFLKTTNGYNLIVETKLVKDNQIITPINEEIIPTETPQASESEINKELVLIKQTETGWLNVRESNSGQSKEITKVNPGEKYEMLEEENGWIKIKLTDGKTGWISAKYAEKVSN